MSAAQIDSTQDRSAHAADARYAGGFDRWNRNARTGWSILWRASEHGVFALGDGKSVWCWDSRDRIWNRIPDSEAAVILSEHDQAVARLRRALPVVRMFLDLDSGSEREAARLALHRIGAAIVNLWQEARRSDGLPRGVGWFDSPAAVYRAATCDACLHMPAAARIVFEADIYSELVEADQEDLRAGRSSSFHGCARSIWWICRGTVACRLGNARSRIRF